MLRTLTRTLLIVFSLGCSQLASTNDAMPAANALTSASIRVATFNSSLNDNAGKLIERLQAGDHDARRVAAVIQRVRPDILLLNEFDFDSQQRAAELFQRRYLEIGQFGERPVHYTYRFTAEVNTGIASGVDINGDGKVEGPNDAYGFGFHPGQFGMLVLSRFPLKPEQLRSFQKFFWHQLPDAHRPMQPDSNPAKPFHDDATWRKLRLSSKSHWDLPVDTPVGRIHLLVSHPTPPVFDGREDLNGLRNRDELGFWRHYLTGNQTQPWMVDDQGHGGPLPMSESYILLGDLNNDPQDGNGYSDAILALLEHPRSARFEAPASIGAAESARIKQLKPGVTPANTHTASFGAMTGNLRVDFVIPSRDFSVLASGVFWPSTAEPESQWLTATDHRMVWMDLSRPATVSTGD